MTAFYLKSGSGVTEFAQATVYAAGARIVPALADAGSNYLVARRWVWECTTGGTSAGANPTWPASVTQDVTTVTSGTAVFTARRPGYSSGSTADWSFAAIYLNYLAGLGASGDVVYISNNHAEAYGAAISMGVAGVAYVCVDDSVAPPSAVSTGASVSTVGEFALAVGANTSASFHGIDFICGVGAAGALSLATNAFKFVNCNFTLASSNGGARINTNSAREWINCGVKFSAAGQGLQVTPGFHWRGGSLLSGGVSPNNLIATYSGDPQILENLDLSSGSTSMNLAINAGQSQQVTFRNCKLPSGWTGTFGLPVVGASQYFACGASGAAYSFLRRMLFGDVSHETTLVKTGGASDGVTPISWKFVSSASPLWPNTALEAQQLVRWNDSTGVPITVSMDFLRDSATGLTNKELWLEVSYYSETGSPLATLVSSAAADYLTAAADYPASTATWTTTGMTNPNKQRMSVTFTPRLKGFIHATVKLAKPSTTVYVDPALVVS